MEVISFLNSSLSSSRSLGRSEQPGTRLHGATRWVSQHRSLVL